VQPIPENVTKNPAQRQLAALSSQVNRFDFDCMLVRSTVPYFLLSSLFGRWKLVPSPSPTFKSRKNVKHTPELSLPSPESTAGIIKIAHITGQLRPEKGPGPKMNVTMWTRDQSMLCTIIHTIMHKNCTFQQMAIVLNYAQLCDAHNFPSSTP